MARENGGRLGIDNVEWQHSVWYARLASSAVAFDLIVSNPPYVNADSMQRLPQEYLHEPQLALASGQDGLDAVRRIIELAPQYLAPSGLLIVEIGHNRDVLEQAYQNVNFTWLETSAGDEFVFLLTREQLPKSP